MLTISEKLTYAKIEVQITEAYPKKQINSVANLAVTPIIGSQFSSYLSYVDLLVNSTSCMQSDFVRGDSIFLRYADVFFDQ